MPVSGGSNMKVHSRAVLIATLAASLVLGLGGSHVAAAVQGSVRALSRDTSITINTDGSFRVEETYEMEFSGGTFTDGFRTIPLDHFESIDNITVNDGEVEYSENDTNDPETFQQSFDGSGYTIYWIYPPAQDEVRTFTIGYTVHGGIIIDEHYGDRLNWIATESTYGYIIDGGTVTVNLPDGAALDTWIDPFVEGASASFTVSDDRRSVVYQYGRLGAGQSFTIGVRFTHGIVPPIEPAWQAAQARAREEAEQKWVEVCRVLHSRAKIDLEPVVLVIPIPCKE
jgi:hypothetical protein